MPTHETNGRTDLEHQCVDTIRMLSVDAVEQAKSGHPGAPMGMADMAFVLWSRFLRFNPEDPLWPDRDRFVLSAGHASMLLYSLLHLFGYEISVDDIRKFRQWGSRTPGHPEYNPSLGIEMTTGPLGQGFAHGVGMACAAHMMAARFNTDREFMPVSHRVFGIVSDGDLMEGVTSEAASIAGTLGLWRLLYLYDSNRITIEGSTRWTFIEDVPSRFRAYGWHVGEVDGHDVKAVHAALEAACRQQIRPSLIVAHTHLAHGCPPAEDDERFHGAPLGAQNVRITKETAGWPLEPEFFVPEGVREFCRGVADAKKQAWKDWHSGMEAWRLRNPGMSATWDAFRERRVPDDLEETLVSGLAAEKGATRKWSGKIIQRAAAVIPYLVGGSADLGTSNNTIIDNAEFVVPADDDAPEARRVGFHGRNLRFGVREHAMGAIVNGMVLHGAFLAYSGTFLVFADYMRPPMRLAALMQIPSIYVFSHDSLFVGEDGPTHQPVEHVTSLRIIPGLTVFRPADALETAMAWRHALTNRKGPVALVLTRQNVPPIERPADFDRAQILKGGYVVSRNAGATPGCVIVATGSEVSLAIEAASILRQQGVNPRVVSVPCLELFEAQPPEYRQQVLAYSRAPIAVIEAGSTALWHRVVGPDGLLLGMDRFGASAPAEELARRFGFTAQTAADRILKWHCRLPKR